jgi:hypothetical protein
MDSDKVATVEAWPHPRSAQALYGFLGLTGYYRKFITGYGGVAAPLTALLKREAFSWNDEAELAFLQLKAVLVSAPLLQLPDFSKRFIVDCDASGAGFGGVLHQGDGTVAYFSRVVVAHHAKLPAYERAHRLGQSRMSLAAIFMGSFIHSPYRSLESQAHSRSAPHDDSTAYMGD